MVKRGILHRDIKPANVMLIAGSTADDQEQIKVLDFGVAKLLQDTALAGGKTRSGMIVGTAEYMAPEQCRGDSDLGAAVDVYALAVMLYEMLGGQRPFTAESAVETMTLHLRTSPPPLRELAPQLPAPLCGLIHRMLAKQPADRPSMVEVAAELARILPELRDLPASSLRPAEYPPATAATFVSSDAQPPVLVRPRRRLRPEVLAVVLTLFVGGTLSYAMMTRARQKPAAIRTPSPKPPAVIVAGSSAPGKAAPLALLDAPPSVLPAPSATPLIGHHSAASHPHSTKRPPDAKDIKPGDDGVPLFMRNKEPDGP